MTAVRIRDMVEADVPLATDTITRASWGVRAAWFEFAISQPECVPVVAELDGQLVGTGVGTANGAVGWVGTIFVAPDLRGRGLGRTLTEAVIDRLAAAGCATLVLVASEAGRPLYERMGFEVQTRYHILEATGLPDDGGRAVGDGGVAGHSLSRLRDFQRRDLDALALLDREATGEDRRHALARFASPDTARVAVADDGTITGFVVRAPWGGGATIARDADAAMAILDARRRAAGPDGRVRVGLLEENRAGLAALATAGLREAWSAPRMIRGPVHRWRPEWIWGQFNHAMG